MKGPLEPIKKELTISRISFILVLLILFITIITFVGVLDQTQRTLIQSSQRESLSLAMTAAASMDGDAIRDLRPGDEQTPHYQAILSELNLVKQTNTDILSVYVMRQVGEHAYFVADSNFSETGAPIGRVMIGQYYTNITPALMQGFTKPTAESEFTRDEWGNVLSSYAPIFDHQGKTVGLVGVDINGDIIAARLQNLRLQYFFILLITFILAISVGLYVTTANQKALDAVKEGEDYLRTLMQSLQTGVIVIDAETHIIISANPFAITKIGLPSERVIGQVCHTFICPADQDRCPITDLSQPVDNAERVLLAVDGERIPILKSAKKVHLGGRDLILETFVDISERKKMEERNAQLIKDLELVNTELKDFAYIVSHDLKAPLRAIGSLSQWLYADYQDKFDEDGKMQLDLLVNRVNRMQSLIEGILEYSRVGRVREEKVPVDLTPLVREILDNLSPPPGIRITIQDPLPVIHFEKTRIEQVFTNLIGNAIKYMGKAEGSIDIGCSREGSFWKFGIRDSGPGIDPKYHEKIFQIFQTLNARDNVESTGIGLSIVKKIIEMYGGRVWVDSEEGKGSIFYFTVPITEAGTSDTA